MLASPRRGYLLRQTGQIVPSVTFRRRSQPDKDSINLNLQLPLHNTTTIDHSSTRRASPFPQTLFFFVGRNSEYLSNLFRSALRYALAAEPSLVPNLHLHTMAPSSATPKSITIGSTRLRGAPSASREATPTASKPTPAKMPRTKSDTEVSHRAVFCD
jgi:hypothetical protein